ncbi:MAG: hypothetical protein ACI8SI_002332, partial [Congregibacter sp.]
LDLSYLRFFKNPLLTFGHTGLAAVRVFLCPNFAGLCARVGAAKY